MGITEMLDELKSKARRDPTLREELLETRKDSQPLSTFCRKCRELGMKFMIWVSHHSRGRILCYHAEEYQLVVARIHLCWREKMIFTNSFLPDWNKKITGNYSEGSIPRGVLACFLPKSRDIQGKMPSPKVIWNAF